MRRHRQLLHEVKTLEEMADTRPPNRGGGAVSSDDVELIRSELTLSGIVTRHRTSKKTVGTLVNRFIAQTR